jgi:probable HAF family extracellular repeat protein
MQKLSPRIGLCKHLVSAALRLWLILLTLLVLSPGLAYAIRIFPTYNIVDLGILPGGDRSYAYGINNANQVVGYSSVEPEGVVIFHAFRYDYSDGSLTDLGTLGGRHSKAYAINDAGQVTGVSEPTDYVDHAFRYSDGIMDDLGALPGGNTSMGYGINNLGQVVGASMVPPPSGTGWWPYHAFLDTGGSMTDLGITATPGYEQTEAYDIHDGGWVVGKTTPAGGGLGHAFLYNGTMLDIGAAWEAYGFYSEAHGINNAGQVLVTAIAMNGSGAYAVIYDAGEVRMIAGLGTVNSNGRALGINNRGEVVGKLANGRAFVYVPENGLVELSSLIVGTNPFAKLTVANAINDLGYIAGYGTLPDGTDRAFLAVPGPGKKIFDAYVPYFLLLD